MILRMGSRLFRIMIIEAQVNDQLIISSQTSTNKPF